MGKAFIGNFMGPTGPQGPQGPPGEIAAMPSIGSNGNWFIGERDTGVLADVDRALSAKIVASTEISEPGFIMDGKTASEKFAELNSKKVSGWGDIEEVSNPYTPEKDGFLRIYYRPSGNTNATVYATQDGSGCFYGYTANGANFSQYFPVKAGCTYQGYASQSGSIQLAFSPFQTE